MTEVRFYHLLSGELERVLPVLVSRSLERGWRAVVMAGSDERVERLVQHLWTFDPASFLPHGSAKDGEPAEQPVWFTTDDENPNGANVLMLVDGMTSRHMSTYDIVCDIFDGGDEDAVLAARRRWKAAKDAGLAVSYWRELEAGGWERKA